MDELDMLLAELERPPVAAAGAAAGAGDDPSFLAGIDFLTTLATDGTSRVNSEQPKPTTSGGQQVKSSAPTQLDPVYFTFFADSEGAASKGGRPCDGVERPHVERSPDTQETTLLSPTSAARELDDIMANLAGVLSLNEPSPTSAIHIPEANSQSPETSLDTMLGTLQTDLKRLGVSTGTKGICCSCKKPIVGKIITAMGLTWHPEHFVCAHCQEEIGHNGFYERDGRAYCNKDYQNLFSPQCAYCGAAIVDKILTALDKTWHPEHFFCAHCGDIFGTDGYLEKDGKAYCHKDYFCLFAPKCGCCDRPVLENYLSALDNVWHPECFVCRDCLTPFTNASFFEVSGMPYCELHYHERQGSLCSACQKPVTGRCIAAMGKRFHPEHFVCAFCLKQLCKGVFKENNDKPYCNACFNKLFL
ncbi:leupaxin-like [Leucoraja erinacea]|uniref:leupaxin-like n=1 Tax=Leucoraja erinaceus TaxID=7782 RepID=UPI0024566FCF|nr:leupaxin-like [Leucoraja erinacea]